MLPARGSGMGCPAAARGTASLGAEPLVCQERHPPSAGPFLVTAAPSSVSEVCPAGGGGACSAPAPWLPPMGAQLRPYTMMGCTAAWWTQWTTAGSCPSQRAMVPKGALSNAGHNPSKHGLTGHTHRVPLRASPRLRPAAQCDAPPPPHPPTWKPVPFGAYTPVGVPNMEATGTAGHPVLPARDPALFGGGPCPASVPEAATTVMAGHFVPPGP